MKFAAIDIGSNAVRFQISRPLDENNPNTLFKKVEFTRLPLRLGDDVFTNKRISNKKVKLLTKACIAFQYLMEIYNVDDYMACATSAMRDAENSKEVINEIEELTGIKIKTITGLKESQLIRSAVMDDLPTNNGYMHIDVGGGSTEVSFLKNGKLVKAESFNVGTVRMFKKSDIKKETLEMKNWIKANADPNTTWKSLGSGGNINKIFKLVKEEKAGWISFDQIQNQIAVIKKHSKKERIYKLGLNPDRAEVIEFAGKIYMDVMKWARSENMYISGKGLKEGIIKELWAKHLKKQKAKTS